MKLDIKDMTLEEIQKLITQLGEKPFRAKQVFQWIHKGVRDFDEMSNLPKAFLEQLREATYLGKMEIVKVQQSANDFTRKYLFRLSDGNFIESVFMKYKYGNSVCVSSQAGCRMGCKFCASAVNGLQRNLTASEMLDQIFNIQRETGEGISNVVIMGMGEPLDNYQAVTRFIKLLHNQEGLNLSLRNITLSTCGLLPEIGQISRELPQINLAISLHAPNDEIRNSLMPINRKYSMASLLETCKEVAANTGRRITFEYALIKGINDSLSHGEELADRLKGINCHVNLIPLNHINENKWKGTDRAYALKFQNVLERRSIPTTIRRELGDDIDAACGQLRNTKF